MDESEIPIDIHTGKLYDWLVSRRIIPKNAQTEIQKIRSKIENALQDMPVHDELVKLLSGAHINYFHCQKIVEILKQTEKDTRSVFGTYGSKRMKDWQEILKLYEQENIYLSEAAQILIRNINYEIPALKKQISKLDQQSDESVKKAGDLEKTEIILNSEYISLCQQLGIEGKNVKEELIKRLETFPKIASNAIENIKNLKESIDYYGEFIKNSKVLPINRHLIKFGNTTVYEYIHKKPPIKIEENIITIEIENEKDNIIEESTEIDFGDLNTNEGVDFNIESTETEENSSGIDWGDDIGETSSNDYGISVKDDIIDEGTAKGDQAYTILESSIYHDKHLDELYELESFLKMRIYELDSTDTSSNILFSLMDNCSTYDAKSVKRMLKNVNKILVNIQSEEIKHLFHLKHSKTYASIIANKLKQKLHAIDKVKNKQKILRTKSVEYINNRIELLPILDRVIKQTKILQKQIESDISKRYKNRVVNLIGSITGI